MSAATAMQIAVASDLEIDDRPRATCDYVDVYPDRVCCFRLLDIDWYVWLRCRVERRQYELPAPARQALRDRWAAVEAIAKQVLGEAEHARAQRLRPDAYYTPPRPRSTR